MVLNKYLDTNTKDLLELYNNPQLIITIDGYEYTAIISRSYNLKTTIPTQIVGQNFDYSGHSIIQPIEISFDVVVSKIDTSEYERLNTLFKTKQLFKFTSMVYNFPRGLITKFKISDESFDTYTISIEIKEIKTSSSISLISNNSNMSIQVYSDILVDGSANGLESTSELQSPEVPEPSYFDNVLVDLLTFLIVGPVWTSMYLTNEFTPYVVSTINDTSYLSKINDDSIVTTDKISNSSLLIENNRIIQLREDYSSGE